jgi:hypothetical protein
MACNPMIGQSLPSGRGVVIAIADNIACEEKDGSEVIHTDSVGWFTVESGVENRRPERSGLCYGCKIIMLDQFLLPGSLANGTFACRNAWLKTGAGESVIRKRCSFPPAT